MSARKLLIAPALMLLLAGPATAQDPHHGAHSSTSANIASTEAFEAANAKMHSDMAIDYSGNADVDFVRSMIPHHQGAIDMARVELEHGKDPELRELAEEVIEAQEKEIADMRQWLEVNGK
jgi:uncharacterized protein (DUF305 family)